jgi:rsbT co-antagonist protein RsbR
MDADMPTYSSIDSEFVRSRQKELLASWLASLSSTGRSGDRRTSLANVEQQAQEFLELLVAGLQGGNVQDISAANWAPVRAFLEGFSRVRALQGFTADQTATFIFSFKKALFDLLEKSATDPKALASQMWSWTELIDSLGLHTFNTFQRSREDVIKRQQADLLELSTPVIKLWEGVLALPMIGTLDSSRTQVVMETLLQRIVETGSQIAILDITGVPTVDTLVAQHLMKTVTAIRLMGADCIISGIRPQIAQTIVHLGVDLGDITTKANLADALALAMKRSQTAPTHQA